MRKRKREPLLGVSPQGDPGIIHRTLVRLGRGIPPVESKLVFDAAAAAITERPTESIVQRIRTLIREAPTIPDVHHGVHALLNGEGEFGYTLPHIYEVRFSSVREYSPDAFEKLKGVLPAKDGRFVVVIAKNKHGSWILAV
jgi:hypothetical protein